MQDGIEHPDVINSTPPATPRDLLRPCHVHLHDWLRFFTIALVVLVCDQASKCYAVLKLTTASFSGHETLAQKLYTFLVTHHPFGVIHQTLVDGFFDLRYIENPGAAWGLLSRSGLGFRTPLFLIISLVSMVLVTSYFRRTTRRQKAVRLALALVMGGAIGNFVDRVRLGYVIDFIDWHIGEHYHWPTFNVADAAITIGALLLLFDMLSVPPTRRTPGLEP